MSCSHRLSLCRDAVLLISDTLDAWRSIAVDTAHQHFKGPLLLLLVVVLGGFVLISAILIAAMVFSVVASLFAKPINQKQD